MKVLKIIGLVAIFAAFAFVGYWIPIKNVLEPASTSVEPVVVKDMTTAPVVNELSTPVVVEESKPKESGVPQNIKAVVDPRRYNKPELSLVVTAEVATADELLCEVKKSETATSVILSAKMVDGKCYFASVPPTDNGSYYINVVNVATQESAGVYQTGFNKLAKWSKEELTKQLNAEELDKMFFVHFNMNKLTFTCEGIDESEAPKSLDRLRTSRIANGWNLTVVETPKYDSYNRITYFKVNVSN